MLPEAYPDPQHLPFNRTALGTFVFSPPQADPGGAGWWFPLQGSRLLVRDDCGSCAPLYGTLPADLLEGAAEGVFFGSWQGVPCRALALPRDYQPGAGLVLENLLAPAPRLEIGPLSLAGLAAQVLHWLKHSRHCGRCGEPTDLLSNEWGRSCGHCGAQRYPAVHPCVIVLISRPGELLLVRKPEWVTGRYSLVAGFVEPGECLEECVQREVAEEVGVEVRNLRYMGSQSWPFPSQLMAGYLAEYAGGEVRLDTAELEDGRWFRLDALPQLPPKRSIARWLIDSWCRDQGRSR